MELRNEIDIDAPAHEVWRVLGERFMHVSEWASPITSSCSVGSSEPEPGAIRSCGIAPFGPIPAGIIREKLTRFDREEFRFEYEAVQGMPSFVRQAVNRWSVERVSARRSVVRVHATLTLKGLARFFSWVIRWQLTSGGVRVLEELKHFVENRTPHPRKLSATGVSST